MKCNLILSYIGLSRDLENPIHLTNVSLKRMFYLLKESSRDWKKLSHLAKVPLKSGVPLIECKL